MALLDSIKNILTDEIKEFVLSQYFDTRLKVDLRTQIYIEPVGLSYIIKLITDNQSDFKKLVSAQSFSLSQEIDKTSDPVKQLALWIDYNG